MASTVDILRKTIEKSNLSQASKDTYLGKIDASNDASTLRNIISNPVVNTTMANLGFNPSSIMRETYKPRYSFKTSDNSIQQPQQPINQPMKPVNKQNIKNAVIITKEQETGINEEGKPEIIKSSIQIVQKAKQFNKVNDQRIPLERMQPFKFSDDTPLLDEKIVNPRIPFSKKLS